MFSSTKRIVPLLDRILVSKVKPLEKTSSGILIPEAARESGNRGTVVAVGPGTEKDKVTLKVGDTVILPPYGGTAVDAGSPAGGAHQEGAGAPALVLLRESEILAKVVDA